MLPDRLAALGITGPAIGRLQQDGRLATADRLVTIDEVSEPRRGQRFAFIMDTRLCDGAFALADGADMLVCESTFADTEAALAREYGTTPPGKPAVSPPNPVRGCLSSRISRNATEHTGDQQLAEQAAAALRRPGPACSRPGPHSDAIPACTSDGSEPRQKRTRDQ